MRPRLACTCRCRYWRCSRGRDCCARVDGVRAAGLIENARAGVADVFVGVGHQCTAAAEVVGARRTDIMADAEEPSRAGIDGVRAASVVECARAGEADVLVEVVHEGAAAERVDARRAGAVAQHKIRTGVRGDGSSGLIERASAAVGAAPLKPPTMMPLVVRLLLLGIESVVVVRRRPVRSMDSKPSEGPRRRT